MSKKLVIIFMIVFSCATHAVTVQEKIEEAYISLEDLFGVGTHAYRGEDWEVGVLTTRTLGFSRVFSTKYLFAGLGPVLHTDTSRALLASLGAKFLFKDWFSVRGQWSSTYGEAEGGMEETLYGAFIKINIF